MIGPFEQYVKAKQAGRSGLLMLSQDGYREGPELEFFGEGKAGLACLKAAGIMTTGGCILGLWDADIGFDWAGGCWVNRPMLELAP